MPRIPGVHKSGHPIGEPFMLAQDGTVPVGALLCDGSSLLKADYPLLYAVIGDRWGTADVDHFNLPDFRGRVLRGKDGGIARDPNRTTRIANATGGATGDNVGSVQDDAMQGHKHGSPTRNNTAIGNFVIWTSTSAIQGASVDSGNLITTDVPYTSGTHGTPRTASESRMKNAYVDFAIAYI